MGASRIQGITVEIGGDTTKLTAALKGVNGEIRTTQSQLRDVNNLLKLDPGNTELLAQKHRLLAEAVRETKEKLETLKAAAEQANEALAKGEITQEQYDGLQREIIETEERLKSLEEQANQSAVAGWKTSDMLGCGTAGVEQAEVLRDKSIIEEKLKKEQGRYETLLDMRMNNEIPKEVFSRKQQEVGERIAELEQRMAQYGDVEPATEADVSGKLENLQRLMEQPPVPEDGEFSEEDIDKYVFGVRVYEDRFEWLLNLSPEARGELDDAGSPVYFTKLTVTPDDERAWFRMHPQWSKSNKYAELEAWIYI